MAFDVQRPPSKSGEKKMILGLKSVHVTNVKCMRMAFDDTQRPPNKCMVKIKITLFNK